MARIKGDASFSASFEPQKASPIADVFYCETLLDLLDQTQQQAHDGLTYLYYGKNGIVFDDPDPTKKGIYILIDPTKPTLPASWVRIGTGGSSLTSTTDVFLISNIDIINGYIDLTNTPGNDIILFYDGIEEPLATDTGTNDGMWLITGQRISFNNPTKDLYEGARIDVKYTY